MNCVMALDAEGRSALKAKYPHAKLDTIQVSVAAPWSHTVSKVISYDKDTPFAITKEIIDELTEKANAELSASMKSNDYTDTALSVIARATTAITANGYQTMTPLGRTATMVSLTQVTALADTLITTAVSDLHTRVFSRIPLERYSAVLMFHCLVRELYPSVTEFCLVDLTYEATELAIVRDTVLQYTTHAPIGVNTLVRNIALRLDIPESDAGSLLKQAFEPGTKETLPEKTKKVVDAVMSEYQNTLAELFLETGDSLAIPRVIFLHSNYYQEDFFDDYIIAAAKIATQSGHTVHTLSHDLLLKRYSDVDRAAMLDSQIDTAGLMSAQFFHKQHHCNDFEQV
jgi:Tfp pilus assembly PilM family ATPase